jgi:hypothetical protein
MVNMLQDTKKSLNLNEEELPRKYSRFNREIEKTFGFDQNPREAL